MNKVTYADYEYYASEFYGNAIAREDFPRLARRASEYIDYYTLGKAPSSPDLPAVKNACCALAERFMTIEKYERMSAIGAERSASETEGVGAVKSETVGSYSVTRETGAEAASSAAKLTEEAKKTLSDTVRMYLIGTGLLYRGGRCHECMRRIQ